MVQAGRQGSDRNRRGARPGERAYAKRLAALGAKVAVTELNLHSYEEFEGEAKDMTGESTVAEIEGSGGTALGVELDVMDHVAVDAISGGATLIFASVPTQPGDSTAVRSSPQRCYSASARWPGDIADNRASASALAVARVARRRNGRISAVIAQPSRHL